MTRGFNQYVANVAAIGFLALAMVLASTTADAGKRHRCIKGGGVWMIHANGKMCLNNLEHDASALNPEEKLKKAKAACTQNNGILRAEGDGFVCRVGDLKKVPLLKGNTECFDPDDPDCPGNQSILIKK
ncbi:MAG: hypothetical protein ACE5DK_11820 [Paracoccaceae bacterium]